MRIPVAKCDGAPFQDGHPRTDKVVVLTHSSRRGRLNGILKNGIRASVPSHKTEGLWTFSIGTPDSYGWGRTGLETTHGMVFEINVPKTFWSKDNPGGALHQNRRIASTGSTGFLRWVVRGKYGSAKLPVVITAVKFLLPSQKPAEVCPRPAYGNKEQRQLGVWLLMAQ